MGAAHPHVQSDMALLRHIVRPPALRRAALPVVLSALCWVHLLGAPGASSRAAREFASPEELQAVFLLNLAHFVKWPADAFAHDESPFMIGVIGDSSLLQTLRRATQGEMVAGRPIRCREVRSAGDLSDCQLVFVGSEAVPTVATRFAELHRRPILFASDTEGFLHLGGHVQFFTRGGRMRLRLAPQQLRRSELHASAQLLRVAEIVERLDTPRGR